VRPAAPGSAAPEATSEEGPGVVQTPAADQERLGWRPWFASHCLLLYFLLAFAISWWVWPLSVLHPGGAPMVPFGPAAAALLVAFNAGGKQGVLRLVRKLGRWRVPVRWYLVTFLLPCLLFAAAAALTVARGSAAPDLAPTMDWTMLAGTFASSLVVVGLFEELGWRGFALPLMQLKRKALTSGVILGVVWAAWHLPELLSEDPGEPAFPFIIMVVSHSVILTWLYNSTGGSLPICMLFHAAFDTAGALVIPAFEGFYYDTFWWAVAVLHVLASVLAVAYAGPSRMVRSLDTKASNGIT
jgi:membrane protease YdiL (CAAX protease family)